MLIVMIVIINIINKNAGSAGSRGSRVGSRVGFAGWVCGFAGFAGCELRIAFKGVAFLISILTDINYYQIMIKGIIIMITTIIIIKGVWGDKYNNDYVFWGDYKSH